MHTAVYLIGDHIKIKINGIIYRAEVTKYSSLYKSFYCVIIQRNGDKYNQPFRCDNYETELIPRTINPKANIQQTPVNA